MNPEQTYWKENQFLPDLINLLPYVIFWKNRESVFLGCNDNFAHLAGLSSAKEVIGKTDYDLPWDKAESDAYRADDQYVMDARRSKINIEESQTLANGEQIVLLTSKVPLVDDQDTVVGILATYINISHLKKKEEELRQAKILAEESNSLKTQFIQNMSHELRTPLNGILGMAQVLSYSPRLNDEEKEQVSKLISSGQTLLQLINDVLNFAKIEARKVELQLTEIQLPDLINKVITSLLPLAVEKNLELKVHYSDNCPSIIVSDALCISQIVTNLVGNAIKFTDKGRVDVLVDVTSGKQEGLILQVSVRDTGVGIPEDQLESIFNRFHQVNPSYTQVHVGTGLGLSIVKKLVSEIGGTVTVESELGRGSTFCVRLPCQAIAPIELLKPVQAKNIDANNMPFIGKKERCRILLVEDSPINQKIMKHMLSLLFDCTLLVANTGADAIAMFDKAFDLVLLDIGLPDISGFQVAEAMNERMKVEHFSVPIVSLTAHIDVDEHHPAYRKLGFAGALIKPVQMPVLNDLIHKILLKQRKPS